jgi:hypothetical protein
MSTYTQAQIAAIGKELASASGGLIPAPVGAAWASAEQGINNNVFGLGASHAGVPAYASTTAAVQATWRQMTSSGVYAATISRLQAAGGNVGKAALAIAESPWHLGAAGVKAAGGVDPYYARVFTQAGIPVGNIPQTPAQNLATFNAAANASAPALAGWGSLVSFPTGHILTIGDAAAMADKLKAGGIFASDALGAGEAKTRAGLALFVGQPWNKATQDSMQASFGGAAGQQPGTNLPTVSDVAGAIAALPAQAISAAATVIIPVVVLVALLWIGKVGLQKTLG